MSAIVAHAAEYDHVADFLHDETAACDRCCRRWYQPPPGLFDPDIFDTDGLLVCEDCAGQHPYESRSQVGAAAFDPALEHCTLRAFRGEVVG